MSTGISMSSVNKIKELADNGDYSLALDILEHQDLSKSLSPQFIRICGEVYYENKRYREAREALVRAHSMAPVGNKIIYSIIKLYLSMGYWKLAERYFEIYKFNQNVKDAGTYRVEYMIAKARRRPVSELYSILVSANDMETSEEWDYEMLLLHAYIRNKDKYNNACVEFRAHYRNSSRLYMLDKLMDGSVDLEKEIYCFPDEAEDTDPEQEIIRETENRILEDDELRIHPKDAKIMIMVEDDAPVTSSMKFKQMWIRSKDKKEQKREQKELKKEENSEAEPKKKNRGFWGIMSKKEEELVDQEMADIQNEHLDKAQLLAEVVAQNIDGADNDNETHGTDGDADMVEISGELSPEETAVYNSEQEQADQEQHEDVDIEENNYVIEEEPEEVVMVDVDMDDIVDDEPDVPAEKSEPVEEEMFDPEFESDGFEETAGDDESVMIAEEPEIDVEPEVEAEEPEADIEPEAEAEEPETEAEPEVESEEPEADIEPEAEAEELETKAEPEVETEELETDIEPDADSEDTIIVEEDVVEETAEPEIVAEETFDFDKAFEALDEFTVEVDEDQEFEVEVDVTEPEPEPAIQEQDDKEKDISIRELDGEEPDIDDQDPDGEESGATIQDSDDEDSEALTQEPEAEEPDTVTQETETTESEQVTENQRKHDFPVFKSSLFPDYNTDGAVMYDLRGSDKAKEIEKEEVKITENLRKEEALISETDRLLARLGIKFNTEFNSILDFSDDDIADTDENLKPSVSDGKTASGSAEEVQDHNKKSFKLKG